MGREYDAKKEAWKITNKYGDSWNRAQSSRDDLSPMIAAELEKAYWQGIADACCEYWCGSCKACERVLEGLELVKKP